MRVMFLVRRFHTNMIPMVEALQRHGHSAHIVSAVREVIEDYTLLEPQIVDPDTLDRPAAEALIESVRPDLVVLRFARRGYLLVATIARASGARTILYNQQPATRMRGVRGLKRDLERILVSFRAGLPLRTITPVYGSSGDTRRLLTTYFHFPMDLASTPVSRPSESDRPTILCVGKLAQPRKRHVWLLDALESIAIQCRVILVGAGNDIQFDDGTRSLAYYHSLLERCAHPPPFLEVDVRQNMSYQDAKALYLSSNIFVLPSEREDAAISPLEAMAAGCAVLLPDANGTSCYVTHGIDGLLFREQDFSDFSGQLRTLLTTAGLADRMGANARQTVAEQHSYSDFVDMLRRV